MGSISIQTAAMVGAGTMGRGIAMCFANAGIPVLLKDTKQEALEAAIRTIESSCRSSVQKGKIAADEMERRLARIQTQLDYAPGGGPMHFADEVGLDLVHRRRVGLRNKHGANWEPNELLARLAESGSSFGKWDAALSSRRAAADDADTNQA